MLNLLNIFDIDAHFFFISFLLQDTITYSFVRTGVDQKPLQYFDIHPLTGRISVMKRVYEDPDKSGSYIVSA